MAIITGGVSERSQVVDVAPLPGRTDTLSQTFSALGRRLYGLATAQGGEEADTFTDVTPATGPGTTPTKYTGVAVFEGNGGQQWFEMLHVFPESAALNPNYLEGQKITFGSILAQEDREYEIYNAFRDTAATLNTITISIAPGIETPDVAVSDTIGAQTSLLDPTSTYNSNLTSGLGTPVRTRLRALQDGLANFDGPVTFDFDIGSIELRASGSRIALLTAQYEYPFSEKLLFKTDIIDSADGSEQRIAIRKNPREQYSCVFRLDGVDRQRFQSQIFDWHSNNFGLPLWHESIEVSTALSSGTDQIQVTGADDVDLRVGGLVVVYQDAFTFDVLTISSVSDTLIETTSTTSNAYAAGVLVMPVRPCRIVGSVRVRTFKYNDLEEFRVIFECTDNNTGAPAGSATNWNPNTHDSKILLDDCNIVGDLSIDTELKREIVVLDNGTGIVSQSSPWAKDKRRSTKGFRAASREATLYLKQLLRAVRGRQVSFYLPTFQGDLTVASDISLGTATMDITNIDYTRFIQSRQPKATFRITFTDGSSLVRTVQSSADHPTDSTKERLTLDTTWPASRTTDEVERVEFYEQVRFNTDEFSISYQKPGLAKMTAPVIVVFDG